jgi:hypothetical protein
MIYFEDDYIVDIDLSLTLSVARLLDNKMDTVIQQASDLGQIDSTGLHDELEHLLGFGIVGFQTYITDITSFAGLAKHEVFYYGPKTESGKSKIEIINAVANYWKHRSEWALDGGGKRKEAVDNLFNEVGYSTDVDYPVSGVLTELLTPLETRLYNLMEIMIEWRNSLFADPKIGSRMEKKRSKANTNLD